MQLINTGTTANDGTGTPISSAFTYINNNFLELSPSNGVIFTGSINLTKSLTNYNTFTTTTGITITYEAGSITGGTAEICIIGDGISDINMSNFVQNQNSLYYDKTLNKENYFLFWFRNGRYFYSIYEIF
jgi:hypothetical protein